MLPPLARRVPTLAHRVPTLATLLLAMLLCGLSLGAAPAQAHGLGDPAVRTVLDGVRPALPVGVGVGVRPSVVDELVLTNSTPVAMEVLARGGEAFLRLSSSGVQANLASPDWYTTGNPEGGAPVPPGVRGGRSTPRFVRVSALSTWAEFDPRLHPPVTVLPAARAARTDSVLGSWTVPLTYGGKPYEVRGHVLFSPIRGGFVVLTRPAPAGLQVAPLQGELPGLFLRAPKGHVLVVQGRGGEPFLRFDADGVQANTASASWVEDQRARGRPVPVGTRGVHFVRVGSSTTYSWLEPRLRYPFDVPSPAVLARPLATTVQHWTVPLTLDGSPSALTGTVQWVPRALATRQLRGPSATRSEGSSRGTTVAVGAVTALAVAVGLVLLLRRRVRRRPGA